MSRPAIPAELEGKSFAQLLAMLLANYAVETVNFTAARAAALEAAYTAGLRDLSTELLALVVDRAIKTLERLPTPAALRKLALELERGPAKAGATAWGEVLKAIQRFGPYRTPRFDDPLVAQAVEAIGWQTLNQSDYREAVADRARFIELYDQLAASARATAQAAPALRSARLPPARTLAEISAGDAAQAALAGLLPKPKTR